MSRQSIVNVFIDLIVKTTFEYFGYSGYNTNRPIILFFVSIVFYKLGWHPYILIRLENWPLQYFH